MTLGIYTQGIDEHKREAQAQLTAMLGLDSGDEEVAVSA
jgi:hypothetical protein